MEDPHHDAISEGGRLLPRLDLDQHADIQVEAIRRADRKRGWKLVGAHVDAG